MNYYVLYNPMAGKGQCEEVAKSLESKLDGSVDGYADMTKITNYSAFLSDKKDCAIVVCGGDGTLNRFINATAECELENEIYYCAVGTGNDFLRDIGGEVGEPIKITEYVEDLPTCEVNGKKYKFINGVGYGIDGYCCEVGDMMRAEGKEDINYAGIAVKGLLLGYKTTSARVVVDGVEHTYKKVWIVPTMHGRFYGGGMMPTPAQDRNDPEGKLSVLVFHDTGKLKTLMIFPSLFKGEHLKHTKYTEVLSGHDITVEFDSPTPLQIDGETILGVSGYRAYHNIKSNTREKVGNEVSGQ